MKNNLFCGEEFFGRLFLTENMVYGIGKLIFLYELKYRVFQLKVNLFDFMLWT